MVLRLLLAIVLSVAFFIPAGCAPDADNGSVSFYIADAWPVTLTALVVQTGDIEAFFTPPAPKAKGALDSIVKQPVAEEPATARLGNTGESRPSPTPTRRQSASPTPNPSSTPTSSPAPKPTSPVPTPAAGTNSTAATIPIAETASRWLFLARGSPQVNLAEVKNSGLLINKVSVPPGAYSQLRITFSEVLATIDGNILSAELMPQPVLVRCSFNVVKGKDTAITLNLDGEGSLTTQNTSKPVFKPVFKVLVAKPPLIPQTVPTPTKAAVKAPDLKPPARPTPSPAVKPTAAAAGN